MTLRDYRRQTAFARHKRGGVSLLEVLISIFVLMVGLLGVAAIISLGGRDIAAAGKADRMTACGQAILDDVKIRGFLNPRMWRHQNGTDVVVPYSGQYWLRCRTYVIDPMFIAYANSEGLTDAGDYPYGTSPTDMARVTFARALTSTVVLSTSEAQRLCTWHDDLLFLTPDESDDRPRAFVLADMGSNTTNRIPWPVRSSDGVAGSPKALVAENEGRLSWMLTVTPIGEITVISGNDYVNVDQPLTYQVSVVVFFNRNLPSITATSERGERTITAVDFVGGGLGGGDAQLTDSSTENLDIRENNWLMLPFVHAATATSKPYEWYRVVATDESGTSPKNVILDGRDWPFTGYNPNAVWSPDVIGVFMAVVPPENRD